MRHEATYHFELSDANEYGPELAIILYNLRFWLRTNLRDNRNIRNGRVWTWKTQKAMTQWFTFWTERQIAHRLKKLEEAGILLRENHNQNAYNHTHWYSLNEDEFQTESPAPEPETPRRSEQSDSSADLSTGQTDLSTVDACSGRKKHTDSTQNRRSEQTESITDLSTVPTDPWLRSHRPVDSSYKEDINTDSNNLLLSEQSENVDDVSVQKGNDDALMVQGKQQTNDPAFEDASEVAEYLYQRIIDWDPDHRFARNKPAMKTWVKDISKAIRIDGREPEHLKAMIDMLFRTNHPTALFWAKNVHSGKKLRMKYDNIRHDYIEKEKRRKQGNRQAGRSQPDQDEIRRRADDVDDFMNQIKNDGLG